MATSMSIAQSEALFARAQRSIPGGVNSPVRAFKAVGGTPIFFSSAKGALLQDVDGNSYLDYVGSWGPMILGHAYPPVLEAVQRAAAHSTSFGAPTLGEVQLAELITSLVPNVEQVRLVTSGTEACMSAVRLARGFTGRTKILKFEGCYHGHADYFLIMAGSGAATLGMPSSPGVTPGTAADTLLARYNDLAPVQEIFAHHGHELAAVIVEPVAGNMGCIPPAEGFLQGLRTLCDSTGTLLIFDEVMTGFRVALGGAQALYGVRADLVTLGKIIGGGLPVGAYAGRKDVMGLLSPVGPVYQAGTLAGNPVCVAAGFALLTALASQPSVYEQLERTTTLLSQGMQQIFKDARVPAQVNKVGSMISFHFTDVPVVDFATARNCDIALFKRWFHGLLAEGIYFPPSAFESLFLSAAHTDALIDRTLVGAAKALQAALATA